MSWIGYHDLSVEYRIKAEDADERDDEKDKLFLLFSKNKGG